MGVMESGNFIADYFPRTTFDYGRNASNMPFHILIKKEMSYVIAVVD